MNPTKKRERTQVPWKGRSSCSTSGTRRVNQVTNPVIGDERGKDWEVLTYPWSFVIQIYHNGQPCHGGNSKTFEVMTPTSQIGTLGSVAFLLAAIIYQWSPDRKHKLWNIVLTERYILHMQVLLECCYIWMESSWWENWNHLFCRNVSFLIASHCRWLAVGRWFSPSAPVSSTNITVRHYITKIYLKGVRHHNPNPILHTIYSGIFFFFWLHSTNYRVN